MARKINSHGSINEATNSSQRLFIYGENYKYLLKIQGEYEIKKKKMGLPRVIDILVTAARIKGDIPVYSQVNETGARGSCIYNAEGENLEFIILSKNAFKSDVSIKKVGRIGTIHVINAIITNARKK